MKGLLFTVILFISACSVSKNPLRKEIKKLQKGIIKEDTGYLYSLPFENNKAHLLVQGYFGNLSHKERAALDFKMKKGTKILAARDGVVVRVKEDEDKGGLNKKYHHQGNNLVIQHNDNSRSGYWHIQKDGVLVNVGDSVRKGQVIALSGNTGFTAFPHLHFIAWKFNTKGEWQQIATRFETSKGIKYPRAWRWYRSKNETTKFEKFSF